MPYFPCGSDADAFVKASENFGDPTAKVMMHQTARLITLANLMQTLDDARDPLSLFFIIVCAECIAKLHADYKKDNKSHEFVTKFFEDHVLPEDREKITKGFTRTALDRLPYIEIIDLLYNIRCDVAHEGRYWGFLFPSMLQPGPIINPHPKSRKNLDAERRAEQKRKPVIVVMQLEELRDIVVRGCIEAVKKKLATVRKDNHVMKKIPLSKVYLTDEVKQAAVKAIESGWYILAKECEAFEAELAKHTGTKHAVLSCNWTAAMLMVHQAMNLKRGDEVLVPSHTAFPSIEPMCHWGAKPVFIDIDDTYCMDVEQLEAAITPRTVGILPVHLYGHPANLDRIFEIAKKHKLWVIEDCAQAQGAKYKGKTVGSMGFCGAFSFFPSKNLTVMGDGGCICTNDDALAERIRKLRNHGRQDKYRNDEIGYNLRFNEIQAAIGRVGLRHLDALNEGRRKVAARYNERLKGIVPTPPERGWAYAVYHMYVVRCGDKRDALAKFLQERGIGTGIHYPVANHQQPAIGKLFKDIPKLPRTEKAVGEILSLPVYGELPLEDVDYVCDCIAEFYGKR